jgi:hypothetical protein
MMDMFCPSSKVFISPFAVLTQISIKSVTQSSSEAVNVVGRRSPGGLHSQPMSKLMEKVVRCSANVSTCIFSGRCEVIAGFDNAGAYSTKTIGTVAPNTKNARAASIWTNIVNRGIYTEEEAKVLQTVTGGNCPTTLLDVDATGGLSQGLRRPAFNNSASHRDVFPALQAILCDVAIARAALIYTEYSVAIRSTASLTSILPDFGRNTKMATFHDGGDISPLPVGNAKNVDDIGSQRKCKKCGHLFASGKKENAT